jgi:hypothetical protein
MLDYLNGKSVYVVHARANNSWAWNFLSGSLAVKQSIKTGRPTQG